MEEKFLSVEQTEVIKEKAIELKKNDPKIKRVIPVYVFGDENDAKRLYVAYLKEPDFVAFSKFSTLGKKDELMASRQLAKDCFLEGDKELIDDDSLFLFGLMPQLISVFKSRQSSIINL